MMTVGQLIQTLAGLDPSTPVVITTPYDNDQTLTDAFRTELIDVVAQEQTNNATLYREISDPIDVDELGESPMLAFGLIAHHLN